MNTDDIKNIEDLLLDDTDMLIAIFDYQKELAIKFHNIERSQGIYVPLIGQLNIDSPKDQDYLRNKFMRIIQELCESVECLKNKPWKVSHVVTDQNHLKEELADALHFFIELCIDLNMTAEDIFLYYVKKNEVNKWRIKSKY